MERDPSVVLLGEDIGVFGGAYRVTEGCWRASGNQRVRDTPISETAIVGAAVGAAMTGLRPVVEIQFNDFLTCAMDQIVQSGGQDAVHDGRSGERSAGDPSSGRGDGPGGPALPVAGSVVHARPRASKWSSPPHLMTPRGS